MNVKHEGIIRLKKSLATWERPHGTARYAQGCRCLKCRAAVAEQVAINTRERRAGRPPNGIVSAGRARQRLHVLSRKRVGLRAVEAHTGIATRTLMEIRAGRKKNVRAEKVRAILNVPLDAHSDNAKIPSTRTLGIVDRLKDEGFTMAEIGRRIGVKELKIGTGITARRAMEIEKLYNRLMAAA